MIIEFLTKAVEKSASDILIIAGLPICYKINGITSREDGEILLPNKTKEIAESIYQMADNRSISAFLEHGDDDFSFSVKGLSRFRVNALRQRGSIGLVIRVISFELPVHTEMCIPENVMNFSSYTKGLVLVTGAAGSGKSTTLACIVNDININRNAHIITIEDPLEFLHKHKNCVVTQREIAIDTVSYDVALRAALREAPDVILLGEMRDAETIRAVVTAAETGHLVISTLHTIGAANTIDRIVDSFPPAQQHQIRIQLALVLEGVVSQQLLNDVDGNLVPAFEVMTVNSAIRNMIRESKAHQLDTVIASSSHEGMITMDQSILQLAKLGTISHQEALGRCVNQDWMKKRLGL